MAADGNMQTHRKTYHKVLGILKYSAVIVLVIAFIVLWLISGK